MFILKALNHILNNTIITLSKYYSMIQIIKSNYKISDINI